MDMYYPRSDYRTLKARCAALCGSSRLPYTPEFGAGCYHAWPPLSLADNAFTTLAAAMHGLRGFNFYMTVDRERWYGAPIRRDGSTDETRIEFYRRFSELFLAVGSVRRAADAILLTTRLNGRLESLSNVFDPLSPMVLGGLGIDPVAWCQPLDLDLGRPLVAERLQVQEAVREALDLARVAWDLGEPRSPVGNLTRYRLAILPTDPLLAHQDTLALLDFARQGGTLVLGPEIPRLDERGKADRTLGKALQGRGEPVLSLSGARLHPIGSGRVVVLPAIRELADNSPELSRVLGALGRLAGCRPLPDPGDVALDVAWHAGRDEHAGCLWLANPTRDERQARLRLPGVRSLEDLWSEENYVGAAPLQIPMPPFTIRPMRVRQ